MIKKYREYLVKMGPNGEVDVPPEFVKAIGAKPGSYLRYKIDGNRLIVDGVKQKNKKENQRQN